MKASQYISSEEDNRHAAVKRHAKSGNDLVPGGVHGEDEEDKPHCWRSTRQDA